MIKLLLRRIQQCLQPVIMLTLHEYFNIGFFRHFINHAFRSLKFRKYISCNAYFIFWKCSKYHVGFRDAVKHWEKKSLSYINAFLLRRNFFQLRISQSDGKYEKTTVVEVWAVFAFNMLNVSSMICRALFFKFNLINY